MAKGRAKREGLSDAIKAAEKKNPGLKAKRIGTPRLRKALKAIALVGNLWRYKPSTAQASYVLNQLKTAVNTVERQFSGAPKEVVEVNMPDA